jgi:twitching motility protein PilT
MAYIDKFFQVLLESGGSDLHLSLGQAPKIRRHGEICRFARKRSPREMSFMLSGFARPRSAKGSSSAFDFAYEMDEENRFRVNYLKQVNGYGAVFRIIRRRQDPVELGVPKLVKPSEKCAKHRLVTGPTGSVRAPRSRR